MSIIIRNGRLVDPKNGVDEKIDIFIDKGKVQKTGKNLKDKAGTEIDAEGKIVAPGLVDMHTHLREPGREDKETIETGARAAIAGGFTTVCAMPNTEPPCDTRALAEYIIEKAERTKLATVLPIGAITKGRKSEQLTEMAELREAGCAAFSDDGDSVKSAALMRRALEYASMLGALVISHCEDRDLAGDGVMNEGYWSTLLGMKPIPREAESLIVERDVCLAERADARLHIAHISTAESVEIVRRAKKQGLKISAEVTPHHFSLTDAELKSYDTAFKVNPPLRTEKDILALKKGLKDGTIDVIATDHAPHLENEKEMEFDHAPFGMTALETALSLSVENLLTEGLLDWPGLIRLLSVNPCRLLGYGRGSLEEGAVADVVVIDPSAKWVYEKEKVFSKATNSPFLGKKMTARVTDVIVSGRETLRNGQMKY
ncbi:MAG: amidohydrolase family protein [Candidatus Omnitrophica bacterium]|nr:amidohydrolase family protein [Candidatus Omnitrophota bacterium]